MKALGSVILVMSVICSVVLSAQDERAAGNERYWVGEMGSVHSKFSGEKGTFAHFGDSITVTLAYWTPLLYSRRNAPAEMEQAYELVKAYMKKECWRDWKGGEFGNTGMMTIRWAHENIETWLKTLNPEVALIMFGTNDLNSVPLAEYELKTRQVVRKCLDHGTVVILSTIPPKHGLAEKAAITAIKKTAHKT